MSCDVFPSWILLGRVGSGRVQEDGEISGSGRVQKFGPTCNSVLGCVVKWHLLYFTGCIALLTRPVTNQEVSRCYSDVNICLWTNGSSATTQSAAHTECRRRYNSFLPHVTDSSIQYKLAQFRNDARSILRNDGFWISVKAVSIDSAHWIDGSPLAGMFLSAPYI